MGTRGMIWMFLVASAALAASCGGDSNGSSSGRVVNIEPARLTVTPCGAAAASWAACRSRFA